MSDLHAEFKALTADVDHEPLWRSLWEQTEREADAGEFVPTGEAIGQRTWVRLANDDERAEARNDLYYAYWKAARHDAEQAAMEPVRKELLDLLSAHRTAARLGKPIPHELLHQIVVLADVLLGGDL